MLLQIESEPSNKNASTIPNSKYLLRYPARKNFIPKSIVGTTSNANDILR